MTKETNRGKAWTKPTVKQLGKIRDVAGAETPLAQGATNKKS